MRLPVKFRRSSLLTKVVVLLVVVSATVILVSQRSQIRSNQAQCQELAGQAAELEATPDMTVSDRLLGVVAALVDKKGIDAQTIAELEQMLEEKRKELNV